MKYNYKISKVVFREKKTELGHIYQIEDIIIDNDNLKLKDSIINDEKVQLLNTRLYLEVLGDLDNIDRDNPPFDVMKRIMNTQFLIATEIYTNIFPHQIEEYPELVYLKEKD